MPFTSALIMCNARYWLTIPVPHGFFLVYFADISVFNFWHAICLTLSSKQRQTQLIEIAG
ncbi:hypothetical protein C5L22_14655 [Pantoea ananatis]|nr:hypothetical protein C5L22_14655 [Pantoea ananatis]